MATKLTLTLDEEVIKAAKAYAKSQGRSVSSLVENHLKSLSSLNKTQVEEPSPVISYSPITNRLRGALKVPADFDYKKTLEDALLEKYQLKDQGDEN